MNGNCKISPKPKSVKAIIRSKHFWKTLAGVVIGGALGFVYYYYVGCSSGACPITSSPMGSIAMGGLFGFFLVSSPCGSCK